MILRGCLFPLSLYLLSLGVSRARSRHPATSSRAGLGGKAPSNPIFGLQSVERDPHIRLSVFGTAFYAAQKPSFWASPKGSRTIACDNIGLPFDSP